MDLAISREVETIAQRQHRPPSPDLLRVRELIRANPRNAKSRHVAHNLGTRRLDWLHRHGLLKTSTRR